MPRPPRVCPAGIAQHIIQRGHNRQNCFHCSHDFATYASILRTAVQRWNVAVHAWVFMSNHVHLLVTPLEDGAVSRLMHQLAGSYVRYYNTRYGRSGALWEGRFRSCLVQDDEYLLQCYRYIELNPVRAGMVQHPEEYHWSSYHSNARGAPSNLLTPHATYLGLGDETVRHQRYRRMFEVHGSGESDHGIREATRTGLVLGDTAFRDAMERLSGHRLHHARPGRPPGHRSGAMNDAEE